MSITNPASTALHGGIAESLPRAISHSEMYAVHLHRNNDGDGQSKDILDIDRPFIINSLDVRTDSITGRCDIRLRDEDGVKPSPADKFLVGIPNLAPGNPLVVRQQTLNPFPDGTALWGLQEMTGSQYHLWLKRPVVCPTGAHIFLSANTDGNKVTGVLMISWIAQLESEIA